MFFFNVCLEHNHELADMVGEKMHWKCHNQINLLLKQLIQHMRENNITLNKIHCVMSDIHGGHESVPFRKASLKTVCASIAHEASQNNINKLMELSSWE